MVPGGLEVAQSSAGLDAVQFEPVHAIEEEPDNQRALLLSRAMVGAEGHGRRESIHKLIFQRHFGTFLLGLKHKKVLSRQMSRSQLADLKGAGFRPADNMHITVLNYDNGKRVIEALGGQRNRLAAVEDEARQIDWRWRPVGEPFAFRGPRSCGVKLLNLVDCPGVEQFYELLETELNDLELDRKSPLHVALMYQRQKRKLAPQVGGISMRSPVDSLTPRLRLVEPVGAG